MKRIALLATALVLLVPTAAEATVPAAVYRMRTGRHATFDRVVFDFHDALPSDIRVEYVDQVRQDGSGDVVRLAGRAFLQVTLEGTVPEGLTWRSRVKPNYPTLKEVAFASFFEGRVIFGVGVAKRVPFKVFTLREPYRVVVDVSRR